MLRRSEVVYVDAQELSPIQNAIHDIEAKTKELAALNTRYSVLAKTSHNPPTNPLSMTLNGVVDAPINGGISNYRQAFMTPEYLLRYPDRAEAVERLRNCIDEQVSATFSLNPRRELMKPMYTSGPYDR